MCCRLRFFANMICVIGLRMSRMEKEQVKKLQLKDLADEDQLAWEKGQPN